MSSLMESAMRRTRFQWRAPRRERALAALGVLGRLAATVMLAVGAVALAAGCSELAAGAPLPSSSPATVPAAPASRAPLPVRQHGG